MFLRLPLRKLCVLCDSAVKENEKARKPQSQRGRRAYAELKSVWIPTPDSTVQNEPNTQG